MNARYYEELRIVNENLRTLEPQEDIAEHPPQHRDPAPLLFPSRTCTKGGFAFGGCGLLFQQMRYCIDRDWREGRPRYDRWSSNNPY
jgi:hypothetical protein